MCVEGGRQGGGTGWMMMGRVIVAEGNALKSVIGSKLF